MQTIKSLIPSSFAFFSMPRYGQYPFILHPALRICRFWSYRWQNESKNTLSSYNSSRWRSLIYCRHVILNYFLGCSRSPSYRYPCSAKRMMQNLGKYSIKDNKFLFFFYRDMVLLAEQVTSKYVPYCIIKFIAVY